MWSGQGNYAATLTRPFVRFIVDDKRVDTLIQWLHATDTADEHLWSTVNYNHHIFKAPGSFPGAYS
jgi:hypothetical protein